MRVLFVSPHYSADFSRSVSGVFQRMRLWLGAIQALGAELEMLLFRQRSTGDNQRDAREVERQLASLWGIDCKVTLCQRGPVEDRPSGPMANYIEPALFLSKNPAFRSYSGKLQRAAFAHCMARSPDVVFFHRLHAMRSAMPLPRSSTRVLLDLDDIEHKSFARQVMQPPHWRLKPLLYLQLPLLWLAERAGIARANLAFVCSEQDQNYLRRTMLLGNVAVIPNAVARIDDRPLSMECNLLFIGTYNYPPNVGAADYLIREVWPHVARNHPSARLLIAGAYPENIPSFQDQPRGVEFLGFVSNLDNLYRRVRVLCCPIQAGGGTRIKILEAASYGVPVVATRLGAEGIDLSGDQEIVVRNDAKGLADACTDLLVDFERARRIGASARERVRSLYSHDVVVQQMKDMLIGEARSATGRSLVAAQMPHQSKD